MGDFISRLDMPHNMYRFTEDWLLARHAMACSREIRDWCAELQLQPLHGRVEGSADADRYTEHFKERAYPLCNAHEETIYHLVTECTYPSTTAYKAWLPYDVNTRDALLKAQTAAAPLTPEEAMAKSDLLSPLRAYNPDPASISSRFLTYSGC